MKRADDPRELAKGLTKAQRDFILNGPVDPDADWWNVRANYVKHFRSFRALLRRGLAGIFGEITPRGQQVRAILENEHDD
jgi:hypothetical protein